MNAKELTSLFHQINRVSNSDWQKKGQMIREAFAQSVQYVDSHTSFLKPGTADKLIETVSQYGDGWMVNHFQTLVIARFEKDQLARYVTEWAEFYSQKVSAQSK